MDRMLRSRTQEAPIDRGGGPTRAVRQMPEPVRFWIAHAPRTWRFATEPWTDLARGRLGGFSRIGGEHELPEFDLDGLDDLFYVPPVDERWIEARDRLAASLVQAGVPALVQLRPGEDCDVDGIDRIYDLLPPLLSGDIERFLELPPGAATVWPLVPGVTDHFEMWDDGCHLLARARVASVQPLAVELEAKERRILSEGRGDEAFDALFHGGDPNEQSFGRVAAEHDLPIFVDRPRTGIGSRQQQNRRLAAQLALAGELSLRLDRVGQGHSLLRAARGAESTHHDLEALAREGNLRIMDWLDAHGLALIRDVVNRGSSTLLNNLLDRYLGRATGEDTGELYEDTADLSGDFDASDFDEAEDE